jgi:hypothetical protein
MVRISLCFSISGYVHGTAAVGPDLAGPGPNCDRDAGRGSDSSSGESGARHHQLAGDPENIHPFRADKLLSRSIPPGRLGVTVTVGDRGHRRPSPARGAQPRPGRPGRHGNGLLPPASDRPGWPAGLRHPGAVLTVH